MDLMRFGSFLAELRHEKGLTQQALGERLGVTNKTVTQKRRPVMGRRLSFGLLKIRGWGPPALQAPQ